MSYNIPDSNSQRNFLQMINFAPYICIKIYTFELKIFLDHINDLSLKKKILKVSSQLLNSLQYEIPKKMYNFCTLI